MYITKTLKKNFISLDEHYFKRKEKNILFFVFCNLWENKKLS